jgi:hypothetical protein
VDQNGVFDVVLWKDTSHRLHGADDEFLKPPFVQTAFNKDALPINAVLLRGLPDFTGVEGSSHRLCEQRTCLGPRLGKPLVHVRAVRTRMRTLDPACTSVVRESILA